MGPYLPGQAESSSLIPQLPVAFEVRFDVALGQEAGPAPSLAAIFGAPADATGVAQEANPATPAGPEAIPADVSLASLVAQAATSETDI